MESSKAMYQYVEKKFDPFWWITFSYIISVLFLLCITMVVGPIIVFSNNTNIWSVLLMLLVPLGIWLATRVFAYARGLIWRNNHLTTYKFYPDTIQLNKWENTYDREPTKMEVELSAIRKVVVAPYIINEYLTRHGTKHIEKSYILYVIHEANSKKELLKLPFASNYENINIWLTYFKKRNIPVQFTTEVLFSYERDVFTDQKRIRRLESNIHEIPIEHQGNWKKQQKEVYREWSRTYPPKEYIEPVEKDNSLFRPIANAVLLSYALMLAITFGLIELYKYGWFAEKNPWPIFVMFFVISLLFFFILRRVLRWYFMLVFIVNAFIFGIAMTMSFEEETQPIASEISVSVLGMAMLFPLVVWIPYLIVKKINNNAT
ncbi:hypothetical protein [Gracilibacillus lacisalsi]|uniref:hypothetical protein n=1 Tax=Gracilibacillus lacisalsi TaxID=393087 RepID=UPI00036EB931|nr:hypothetical protein [Gracilibacillus lacisalsi]